MWITYETKDPSSDGSFKYTMLASINIYGKQDVAPALICASVG
jgi:hypothetical protein